MVLQMRELLEQAARAAGVPRMAEASGRSCMVKARCSECGHRFRARIGKDVKKDSDGNPVVQCPGCDQEAAIDVLEAAASIGARALLHELGGQTFGRGRSRGRDPYWITAKYAGKDAKGTPFRKGERVFYYPNDRSILAGKNAEQAAAEFQAAADDERTYNYGAEGY